MARPARSILWRDLGLVTGVSLLVRLGYFLLNSRGNPAFDYLIMDSMHIDRWAKAIAAGDAGAGVYFRGPLYPYLLALIYKASNSSVAAAVLVNHVAGALTCGLVYLLARQYVARAVALVAGLVAALYWPFIYFEGEILIEPVYMMLVVLGLWRTARALARPTTARLLLAGACLGLAALARPTVLAFIPAIPVLFLLAGPRAATARTTGQRLLASGLVVAAALAMLVPATVHNLRAGNAFVPVAWSGGLNFYIGNNESSDGRSAFIPGTKAGWMGGEKEALAIAAAQAGRPLAPAEASSFYTRKGLDWIAQNPSAAAALATSKLHMFWEGPERSNEKYIYFFWDRFGFGRVPMPGFWLVSPLALAAMIRLWPRRRELALLYLFVLCTVVGVVAFFVVARYRLPVVPVLVVLAAWALVDLFQAVRGRRWGALAKTGIPLLVCFAVANASYPGFLKKRTTHIAISHYTLAGAYLEHGDKSRAILELDAARRAFERAPSRYYANIAVDIYLKLGALWYERGRCDEATKALRQIPPADPRAQAARSMFADCCEKTGRIAEAGRAYQMMLKAEPGNRGALEGLIRCLEATGQYDEADQARKQLEALEPPPSPR
jgi:4-amino-4-deoxy-L-arabinose transferase-like glycosyltransferase